MCDPFTRACCMAMGCSPQAYLKRRADRDANKQKELIGAIPDYDPAEAKQIAEKPRTKGLVKVTEQMLHHRLHKP
jgi:hypothetical protein